MKVLFVLTMAFLATAQAGQFTCNVNQQITIENDFGQRVNFRSAEITVQNYEDSSFASMVIQDRFGPGFEVFNRLWTSNSRCRSNSVCLSTGFSSLEGISIQVSKSDLTNNRQNFTGRLRDNRRNRTYFANCRVN